MVVAAGACGYTASTGNAVIALAVLAATAGVLAGVIWPAAFLAVTILVRPLLDGLAENSSSIGGLSLNLASVLGVAIVAVCLIVVSLSRRQAVRPAAVGGFWAVIAVSVFAAGIALKDVPATGGKPVAELVRLGAMLAIYILAANYSSRDGDLERLFLFVGLSAVIPALIAIFQLVTGNVPVAADLSIERLQGTFSGPVAFGTYMAIAALILISLPSSAIKLNLRVAALIPIVFALVGSYSRTGWIIFLLGLLALEWRRRKQLVVVAALVAVMVALLVPDVRTRILPSQQTNAGTAQVEPSSYAWRLSNWDTLFQKFEQSPLIGFGLRTAPYVNPRRPPIQNAQTAGSATGYDAHNSVLKLLIEGGIPLLAVWGFLIWVILRTMRRLSRLEWRWQSYARTIFVLWGVLTFVGFAADDPLAATAAMYAVLVLTGALEGAYQRSVAPAATRSQPRALPPNAPVARTG